MKTPLLCLTALALIPLSSVACSSAMSPVPSPRPNISLRTMGGKQLWADVRWQGGWRVQEHALTGHARVLDPGDVRRAWGPLEECLEVFEASAPPPPAPGMGGPLVVMLHGLGRSHSVWGTMETALEEDGFTVVALSYPSTQRSPQDHAEVLSTLLRHVHGYTSVSFVTHSMGGILVRELLTSVSAEWQQELPPMRAVMLAPPNQGSALARHLSVFKPLHWVAGNAGRALTPEAMAERPAPDLPILIIAGSRGEKDGWNPLIPGDDDGVVGVEETRLEGAQERLVIRGIHTFLMKQPVAIDATRRFLALGI